MSKSTLKHAIDGKTFTRTTARPYTHVIVIRRRDGQPLADGSKWGIFGWTGNAASKLPTNFQPVYEWKVEEINNGVAA